MDAVEGGVVRLRQRVKRRREDRRAVLRRVGPLAIAHHLSTVDGRSKPAPRQARTQPDKAG
jgi:hypothetical protein